VQSNLGYYNLENIDKYNDKETILNFLQYYNKVILNTINKNTINILYGNIETNLIIYYYYKNNNIKDKVAGVNCKYYNLIDKCPIYSKYYTRELLPTIDEIDYELLENLPTQIYKQIMIKSMKQLFLLKNKPEIKSKEEHIIKNKVSHPKKEKSIKYKKENHIEYIDDDDEESILNKNYKKCFKYA